MFKLESYIKRPKKRIDNLSSLNQNSGDYFVKLGNDELVREIIRDIDSNYMEGVIYFEYNGSVLMDFTYWDIVDQLWAYMINLVEEFLNAQEAEVNFPDQPIKLKIKAINKDLVLFSIESSSSVQLALPKYELFRAILDSSEEFFFRMQDYSEGDLDYSHELGQISKLKCMLN